MDLIDQSIIAELPVKQRQAVCRQIRQRQVKKYAEFEKSDKGRELEPRRKNKRGTNVKFPPQFLLQDAVDSFDDREVYKYLYSGLDVNFVTGNGTSLLHRCASEDNVTAAQILLTNGADLEITDDDWWTPLHTACSCDSVEVLQLLLKNKANVEALDVDGYYPVDVAPDGSESKTLIVQHQESLGITSDLLHKQRQQRPQELLDHIKGMSLADDVNALINEGVTLLHIAAANGYKSCIKLLFKYNADVNKKDNSGWTPLHVGARYNQTKAVELLLKRKANPNILDSLGCKPSAVTSSDELRGLLMRYERRFEKKEVEAKPATEENVYEEIGELEDIYDDVDYGRDKESVRLNNKTVRAKRSSISKEDGWMEAKTMYKAIEDIEQQAPRTAATTIHPLVAIGATDDEDHEDREGDYVSNAIWRAGAQEQHKGHLAACMPSDDLVTMTTITEEAILQELKTRYSSKQIYTYIGGVLIAVNPFQELQYYSKDISMKYHQSDAQSPLPPHIYGIAENSFTRMMRDKTSQCHVISGESGSGKTESCKHMVQHLLRVAGSEEANLNSKINQVNPLLEAFGNATTLMNLNSSRFGKYVELMFAGDGKVLGGTICQYLLEKSRIVHQGAGECNFHIFYWMMAGLLPEEALVYKLQKKDTFRYLSGKTRDSMSAATLAENKAKFWEVKECLKFIGFSPTDIQNVLLSLSIVLHLGEIRFTHVGNNEAAQVSNLPLLQKVSEMLEVPTEELGSALVADYTVTRGEQIKKERTVYQAEDCRDALAKSLYARLFAWIVNGINQLIQPHEQDSNFQQIGILDIFGFENFQKNSFEQICINVTNEQIQCYTNENIFYNEQQDCLLEGVPLVELNFTNNLEIIDLFLGRKMSILTILDEECSFPKATDKSLATKLHHQFGKKQNKYYSAPKDGGLSFQIAHYAGSVTYDVRGMLEKNRDTLPNSVLSTMKASSSFLVKELFQSRVSRTGSIMPSARQQRSRRSTKKSSSPFEFFKKLRGRKDDKKSLKPGISVERKGPSTVAFHFRNSLHELLPKLQASNPHFIKCIKPNTSKTALTFDPAYVAKQLRYTGISDVVRIRKFGYVTRLTFHEFLNRYDVLTKCSLPHFCPMGEDAKCRHVMTYYLIKGAQFGKTKVFLRLEVITQLDAARMAILRKVLLSQAATRGFLARRRVRKLALERTKCIQQQQQAWAMKGLDENRNEEQLKKLEIDRITRELGTLDDVINNYDSVFSVAAATTAVATADDEADPYDDAFSMPPRDIGSADDVTSVRLKTASTADDMNGHMQRGLPPTPTHGLHIDPSRPPPCPREMYSQGMYACIDGPEEHEYRKQAPPPPRRNPETRLSTASVSSTSSATYEELPAEDQYHHHQHHQQQQQRHTTHGSPLMRSKFTHEPQSPSHLSGNRPFSYGASAGMSPQQKPANGNHANGHTSHQHHNVLPNYQYTENHTASPAASYGKQESVFHPQPHRPPPHGPPPPPPQSPKMQRHSIPNLEGSPQRQRAQMSPLVARKLSQRSQSVPNTEDQSHLPLPPTHLKEGYSSGGDPYRPESPPLPPPPPEMLANSYILPPEFTSNVPPSYHGQQSNQSLPATQSYQHQAPGTVSSAQPMPGYQHHQQYQQHQQQQLQKQHQQFSEDAQGRSSRTPPPPPPITSIPKKETSVTPPTVLKKGGNSNGAGRGSNSPAHSSREPSPSTTDLIGELGKIQLKKTGLKPAPEEEATHPPPEPRPETPPVQQEETTPPPVEDKVPVVSPKEFVSMFEKKAEMASKGDTSKNSKMEIDIDDIDLDNVPGYTPITKATPVWKRDMIEKKNQEKLEEYIRMRQKEKEEADKWKNVPAWKRKLMMEKEKEKESKSAEDAKQEETTRADEEANKKRRAREAEELKKQKIREQQEYEKQMEEELKDVPAWKREIMMKKGGALKNWGDERAEINDQVN